MKILLSDFEDFVSPQIYARGEAYYYDDAVFHLKEETPGEWVAHVHGSEDYNVEISLKGNRLDSWYCDCPYDGEFCKHVVATLLKIRERAGFKEEMGEFSEEEEEETENDPVGALLELTSKEALVRFSKDYASSHPEFREAFLQRFMPGQKRGGGKVDYRNKVAACFKITGKRGYWEYDEPGVDWEEAAIKMDTYFKKAALFLEQGAWQAVADIALQTFESVMNNYIDIEDDPEGNASYLCEEAAELLLQLIENTAVPSALKQTIISELEHYDGLDEEEYTVFDVGAFVMKLRVKCGNDREVLEVLDRWIAAHPHARNLDEFIIYKIEILYRLGKDQDARLLTEQFLHLSEVRDWEVERLVLQKQYKPALDLLDKGIEEAGKQDDIGLVCNWLEEKIAIYRQVNDVASLIETAKELFIREDGDMKYYLLLKNYVPADSWKTFLDGVIQQVVVSSSCPFLYRENLAKIYIEEKNDERLLTHLQQIEGERLEWLMQFAIHLKGRYSKEMLELFVADLRQYAGQHVGREYYEYIAKVLHKMLHFKNGDKAVQALVEDFRIRYRRRPVMIEILQSF